MDIDKIEIRLYKGDVLVDGMGIVLDEELGSQEAVFDSAFHLLRRWLARKAGHKVQ